ncbi:N-acetyltransferase [Azorhizobium oxalatiphilum]|uniref:N-acetyltransferase n=1 Tax=Azorhizobium oxalatiphilum TaxID=980631 RepID=A0A917BVN2_9HYPH|nr:N-acetyltransferase [Azorhizobium oxalatiphilum]GGF60484.1 N-acetyltransferase [Azorhizobium oxalatiphilum]
MTELPITVAHETPAHASVIDRLHQRTFGPGRFARTAFRLRENVPPDYTLSFTAHVGTMMVGSVRQTPIFIGTSPAILLGPLTVEPPFRAVGIGARLMNICMDEARTLGHQLVLLVGDEPYYRRFGFKVVPHGRIAMPGPVDPGRLLIAELNEGAFEGISGPARSSLA